jgi:regulator of cell morphogenesis and NO signaling
MMDCDLDCSIPDWIIDYPETQAVFESLGFDVSCAGKSLEYVATRHGIDPLAVLKQLHQKIETRSIDNARQ